MKRHFGCRAATAAALSLALLFPGTGVLAAENETAGTTAGREEVIYANLGADGAVEAVYAVNVIQVTEAGEITDYGIYDRVVNLTDSGELAYADGTVTAQAQAGNFYYQGDLSDHNLPWEVSVTYTLDGAQVDPAQLGGRSGKLEIRITTERNPAVDEAFYENYMLQISLTLDTARCTEIQAEGAALANAGSDKMVTFTVMPAARGDMTVQTEVTDFEMEGISISAVPFSMELDLEGVDEMTAGFSSLAEAVESLNEGVAALSGGASELDTGAGTLAEGSAQVRSGLTQLSGQGQTLTGASGQILAALQGICAQLNAADPSQLDLAALSALPEGLNQMAQSLADTADGLEALSSGYSQALAALESAVSAIPSGTPDADALAQLQRDNAGNAALETLLQNYQATQTVRQTYAAVSEALTGMRDGLPAMADGVGRISDGLQTAADQISDALQEGGLEGLGALTDGLTALQENYSSFHTGLAGYLQGVDTVAGQYAELDQGIRDLSGGTEQLSDGLSRTAEGTDRLSRETGELPEQVERAVEELTAPYDTTDFVPVSFVSPGREADAVQFVLQTQGIEREDPVQEEKTVEEDTFWSRLWNLFFG